MTSSSLEVATYGQYGVQKIQIPKSGKAGDVLQLLSKQLSMKPNSASQCFALYVGELGSPILRLENTDSVVGYKQLSLQRHGVDCSKEHKLLKTDDVAVHLLYSEALANYTSDTSKLHPTDEQKENLEEFLDPAFLSERQFLETAQNVEGYCSERFEGEVVHSPIVNDSSTIPQNAKVVCTCNEDRLTLKSYEGVQMEWKWEKIRRWRLDAPDTTVFEVTNIKGNARVLEYINIRTKSAAYLLQCAKSFCTELSYKANPSLRPVQAPTSILVGRPVDHLYDFVNTALYGSGPYFTSVTSK